MSYKTKLHTVSFTVSILIYYYVMGLPKWLSCKESVHNVGVAVDVGLIPGLGRSPEGGHTTSFSILDWRIPWTEEPGTLQSIGSQRVRHD